MIELRPQRASSGLYFNGIYKGRRLKLRVMVQKPFILSKRFFGIPSFFNYFMADGIFELLKKDLMGLSHFVYRGKTCIPAAGMQFGLCPN